MFLLVHYRLVSHSTLLGDTGGSPDGTFRSMTVPTLPMKESFYTPVSQHRNKGLNARRTFKLIAFDSVDFLHGINGGTRFTRQQFNFRFSRNG